MCKYTRMQEQEKKKDEVPDSILLSAAVNVPKNVIILHIWILELVSG